MTCKQAGFPHSEILGSKSVRRLPEAYRKPLRPSSPSAAKASTICAYSLDHITPSIFSLDPFCDNFVAGFTYFGHILTRMLPRSLMLRRVLTKILCAILT